MEIYDEARGQLPKALYEIKMLDPALGMTHCGSAEAYLDALSVFARSITKRAEEIGRAAAAADYEAYTLAVHSLKSTSRAVGAVTVSDLARELEQAGKVRDEETIQRETPRLLSLYQSLEMPLAALFTRKPEDGSRTALSEEAFKDALAAVRESAARYDYDGLLTVVEMLEQSEIPDAYATICRRLREAADDCDWDAISDILRETENEREQDG